MKKIINGLKTEMKSILHRKKEKFKNATVFHAFLFTKGILLQ